MATCKGGRERGEDQKLVPYYASLKCTSTGEKSTAKIFQRLSSLSMMGKDLWHFKCRTKPVKQRVGVLKLSFQAGSHIINPVSAELD